jgi:hypothetical protein
LGLLTKWGLGVRISLKLKKEKKDEQTLLKRQEKTEYYPPA